MPASLEPDPLSVEVDVGSGTASIDVCEVNSCIRLRTGGDPDGSDLVLDDAISVTRQRHEFVRADGTWNMIDSTQIAELPAGASC